MLLLGSLRRKNVNALFLFQFCAEGINAGICSCFNATRLRHYVPHSWEFLLIIHLERMFHSYAEGTIFEQIAVGKALPVRGKPVFKTLTISGSWRSLGLTIIEWLIAAGIQRDL